MKTETSTMASNLQRWEQSGAPEQWVQRYSQGWNHQDWLDLLTELRKTPYWPMDEGVLGQILNSTKDRLRAGVFRSDSIVSPKVAVKSAILARAMSRIVHGQTFGPYRGNVFRILGVPTDADPKQVRNAERQRTGKLANGISVAQTNFSPLPLQPAPEEKQRKEALECLLTKPLEHFIHELFWFWPTEEDRGQAMSRANLDATVQRWMSQTSMTNGAKIPTLKGRMAYGIAAHNLAVYYHTRALDSFATTSAQGSATDSQAWELMDQTLRYWHMALNVDAVREYMCRRAGELPKDPNLTPEVVSDLVRSLPERTLQICSSLAAESLRRGNKKDAENHIARLRSSPFSSAQKDLAVQNTIGTAGDEIKHLSQSAEGQANGDPRHAGALIQHLHQELTNHFAIIDLLLPQNDTTRIALHDLAAEALLQCNYAFANKTENWEEAIKLAELAEGLAAGVSAKEALRKRISSLKDTAKKGLDWCAPGYWELPVALLDRLEAIRELRTKRQWDEAIAALVALILEQESGEESSPTGKILDHCLAICLVLKGVDYYKQESAKLDAGKDVIDEIWDKLMKTNKAEIERFLSHLPNPYMGFNRPPCLRCGKTSYTRWVNFTYREIPLWMCADCSAEHDGQRNRRKERLRKIVSDCAIYSVLATDFDPTDVSMREDLKATQELMTKCDGTMPSLEQSAKKAELPVAPPSLRKAWRRKQKQARKELEHGREIRAQIAEACKTAAAATDVERVIALARNLFSLVEKLAGIESAKHLVGEARIEAADTLLAIEGKLRWPENHFMDCVTLLETALSIAADTTARARVEQALAPLKAKAARKRRIKKLKIALVTSAAAISGGVVWYMAAAHMWPW